MVIRITKAVDDLLHVCGLSGSELARRLGVEQPAIPQAKARGVGITLGYLQQLVGAAGYRLELHIFKKNAVKKKTRK